MSNHKNSQQLGCASRNCTPVSLFNTYTQAHRDSPLHKNVGTKLDWQGQCGWDPSATKFTNEDGVCDKHACNKTPKADFTCCSSLFLKTSPPLLSLNQECLKLVYASQTFYRNKIFSRGQTKCYSFFKS